MNADSPTSPGAWDHAIRSDLLKSRPQRALVVTLATGRPRLSCASCHSWKPAVDRRKTRACWAQTVSDMIQRGAAVFAKEIEPVTTYLWKAFGTDELINFNTASREEMEKRPNLKPGIVARILAARDKVGLF